METDMAQTASTPIGFLSFPPEVRNQIYKYLFTDAKLGISTVHSNGPSCNKTICICTFPVAITLTCRLLRHETQHLLFAATTLEITNCVDKTSLLPEKYLSNIRKAVLLDAKVFGSPAKMPMARFTGLELLELRNVSVWCKYFDEEFLESQDADECMFNLAMFNLRRISPALIDLCNTNKRNFKVLLGCQFIGNSMRHETVVSSIICMLLQTSASVYLIADNGPESSD